MNIDEKKIKEELKVFLKQKLEGSSMLKKYVLMSIANKYVDEFIESLKTKYPCSDSKPIKKGENHVQSDSSRKSRFYELQTFIRNFGHLFEEYRRRYTR